MVNSALQLLNQPETVQVLFGAGQTQPPRGRVFVNPQRGVLLMASNLPAPPPGKTYEMWVVPKAGGPVPAGLFRSDTQGHALYVRNEPINVTDTKAIAVTMEPEAGSMAPTLPLVLAAPLSE
jgi:anti-sigma-K factor RskA